MCVLSLFVEDLLPQTKVLEESVSQSWCRNVAFICICFTDIIFKFYAKKKIIFFCYIMILPGKDKCDFSDDLCLWSNVGLNNSFAWVRHRYEQSLDDGPLADHTKPGSKGFFLVASNKFADKGEKAKLLSTVKILDKLLTIKKYCFLISFIS